MLPVRIGLTEKALRGFSLDLRPRSCWMAKCAGSAQCTGVQPRLNECRSPGASEALAIIDCEDALYAVRLQVFESLGNQVNTMKTELHVAKIPVLVTDSTNVHDRMQLEVCVCAKGPRTQDIT